MGTAEPESTSSGEPTSPTINPGHQLNAKTLTDAFSDREIICGLYKPEPGEAMVPLATKAARHADLIILDWLLEGTSPARAKDILIEILKEDRRGNGRLRLIAIYTSQPGIDTIAKDVFEQVQATPELKGSLEIDGAVLSGANVRICVLSKPQTLGGAGVDKVAEAELPSRLLKEFSALSRGLLTSFALHSIAAVRRAAHHVVAVFKEDLDGAFLAHRSSIGEPDDATELAINLLVGELQNAITVDERADGQMSEGVLDAWVDVRAASGQFARGEAIAPAELVKSIIKGGATALEATKGQLKKADGQSAKGSLDGATIGEIFYSDAGVAWDRQLELARLSSFKREAYGRTQLPNEWLPTLTLGSVLKMVGPISDTDQTRYDDLTADYYICMQPRCDSVRLSGATGFPFQTAQPASKFFNLVVKDRDTASGTPILVNSKLGNTVVLRFKPDELLKVVRARREGDDYIFDDIDGRRFSWIGDIRDLKAQHDASALAANVHRVGLNEQEWLRLATRNGVEIPPAPAADAPGA